MNGNGGAICAEHVERLMVDGAVFARNRAPRGCGGAIYAAGDGAVRLTEQKPVEFCENHANVGGAVFLAGNRPAQATQNRPGRMLFSGNTARTQGNAIYVCGGAGGPFEK